MTAQTSDTSVTVSGVGGSTSGDAGRRDDHEAYRSGASVLVTHRSDSLTLNLAFSPTTEGYLDLTAGGAGRLRFSLRADRWRRYSDTTVHPNLLPSGVSVEALYPFSNSLRPAFGDLTPVRTRQRFDARLAYLLDSGGVELSLRGVDVSGERAIAAGGMTFADNGSPAFFPAALGSTDTSEITTSLMIRGTWLGLGWRGGLAVGTRDAETAADLPTFGNARLLDVSRFTLRTEADTRTANLALTMTRPRLSWVVGGAWSAVDSTPSYRSGVVTAAAVDTLSNGHSDATNTAVAAAVTARPMPGLALRLAGRLGRRDLDADGVERFGQRDTSLAHSEASDSWCGEAEANYRLGVLDARLHGSRERHDRDDSRRGGDFSQIDTTITTRDTLRADFSVGFPSSWRARLGVQRRTTRARVDLQELVLGYALTDRDTALDRVALSVRGKVGAVALAVLASNDHGTAELQPPAWDPVYDPSWDLTPAKVRTDARSYLLHAAAAPGDTLTAWVDLGWRRQRWNLLETVTLPGFINGDEEVRGWTGGLGGAWTPSDAWRFDLSAWADAPSEAIHHRAVGAEFKASRTVTAQLTAFAGLLYRRFDEALYHLDNYRLTALTLGVSGRF